MNDAVHTSVEQFLTFSKLNAGYDPLSLEDHGVGFLVVNEGVRTAFCHSGSSMRFVSYLEFGPGAPRGNHYHREKLEHLCIVKGEVYASYFLPDRPDEVLHATLSEGDIAVIQPGCVHSYIAKEPAVALEFSPQAYDQSDVVVCSSPAVPPAHTAE